MSDLVGGVKADCVVEGCLKSSRALQMCDMHYRRNRRVLVPHENKNARDKWRAKNPDYKSPSKQNKILLSIKQREYRAAHNEELQKYIKNWRDKNRVKQTIYTQSKRAKKKQNGTFVILEKEAQKLRTNPCFYCGSFDDPTVDHLIPLNRGGVNSIGNMVTACRRCNSSKQDKLKVEWEQWKKAVGSYG